MRSLVIGAGGFVGRHLMNRLIEENSEVYAAELRCPQMDGTAACYDLDVRNYDDVTAVISEVRPDRIYHLAAISAISAAAENPQMTVDINVNGCVNVLEAVRKTGLKTRILLIGSAQEYGETSSCGVPLKEDMRLLPTNIYAVSKCAQEMMGRAYVRYYNMDIMSVRAFNHCGPGQADNFVVSDFCKQAAEIEKGIRDRISVGNLSAVRDFTDVRDVVRAYTLITEKGISGKTYNVGGGAVLSVSEILDIIVSMASVPIKVEKDEKRMRPIDTPRIEADITELKKDTGWSPAYPLEQTVKDTLEYWRGRLNAI